MKISTHIESDEDDDVRKLDDRRFPVLDRSSLTVAVLGDKSDEIEFWLEQTPQTRIRAVEMLRRLNYGIDATTSRLQRLLELDERSWS